MAETYEFPHDSGWLALDFNNTLDEDLEGNFIERLNTYDDLVEWSVQLDILSDEQGRELRAEAEHNPDSAQAVLMQAIELRRVIYRIFSAVSAEQTPDAHDMAALNHTLGGALGWLRVGVQENGFDWHWADGGLRLDQMLWRVAWSAAQLLVSDLVDRVHECENDLCTWMFIDETRNHSRRWCSMEGCGNRMKARRHYRRTKGKAND